MQFEKFHYDSLKSIQDKAAELGVTIPLSEDMKILAEPMTFGLSLIHISVILYGIFTSWLLGLIYFILQQCGVLA